MLLSNEISENRDVFKTFIKYGLWCLLFIVLIVIYIWQNIIVADMEYNLKKMETHLMNLQKEHNKLETEITFLGSPERIGMIAEKELKLELVKQEDIIWIEDKKQQTKVVQRNFEIKNNFKEN